MEAKITKKLVDQVQPTDKEIMVFDTALKGFVLRVTPAGTKTYAVRFRTGGRNSPLKTMTIGKHGSPWTPDQARTEAEKLLGLVAQGTDPAAERKAQLAKEFTVAELADRYVTQHVELKNKASTAKEAKRLVEKVIKPEIGPRAVASITRGDISALHHRLRETPRMANHSLSILSKMFSLAEVWGFRPDASNPCRRVEKYKETQRERFLSNGEIARLGEVIRGREETYGPSSSLHAVTILLLSGLRVGEAVALRWDDVRLNEGVLVIRDAKAGGRLHAIGGPAIAYLADMPRESEWVFTQPRGAEPISVHAVEAMWARLRTDAGLEDVRLHDLRHTVGTFAGQTGAGAFLVRDKLGHKTLAMTGRYVNRDADPLRELSDKVEGRIMGALKAGAAAAKGEAVDNVVPLPKGRKRKPQG